MIDFCCPNKRIKLSLKIVLKYFKIQFKQKVCVGTIVPIPPVMGVKKT